MYWKALSKPEIRNRVFTALKHNINYNQANLMGVPASYLDQLQFNTNHPILKDAPFLLTMIHNPNHIGCHTLTKENSEAYFRGTQELELELIETIACEVFKAKPEQTDGYVAPGGTEANIQAQWIYRNYFQYERKAELNQIGLFYTEDAHYSMPKGANLLGLNSFVVPVEAESRKIDLAAFRQMLENARLDGIKYIMMVLNMGTTMFGSVDEIDPVVAILKDFDLEFKIHIDAAFGGFIYPFTNVDNELNFMHPQVNSITVDGHKMLQAPYGTGVFLIRKGWMQYTTTDEASYVSGLDSTLCGSRSGANAIAMWMITMGYGSDGWTKNCQDLIQRTDALCQGLDQLDLTYYRDPNMNIVTLKADQLPSEVAHNFHLVADDHDQPNWYKIVVMPHVSEDVIHRFLNALRLELWVSAS